MRRNSLLYQQWSIYDLTALLWCGVPGGPEHLSAHKLGTSWTGCRFNPDTGGQRLNITSNSGVFFFHSCPESWNVRMATFGLVRLWESLAGSPGKWSDWVCSSIWLSYWCLPRLLPAEERFCSYQRRVTCLRSSCHQVSSQSGPREHLSPSLNWLQDLIKALLRDEGDKNDAPLLRGRRTLKENVLPANYLYSLFGQNTPKPPAYSKLGLQLWARLLYFCQHSSLWCSICPISLSIHSPPTFPCIVNLIPQWAEHKELTRPPRSHKPDAASSQRATDSLRIHPDGVCKRAFSTHSNLCAVYKKKERKKDIV